MNFSFFNRNYPNLFCYASFAFRNKIIYREKHTMTKCLKRSLNALPQLFSQIFPNPLPQTPQKTTKYKTMPYRDFHAYYSFAIKIKTLLLLSLFIRKKCSQIKKYVFKLKRNCKSKRLIAAHIFMLRQLRHFSLTYYIFINVKKTTTNGQLSMFPCIDHFEYFRR